MSWPQKVPVCTGCGGVYPTNCACSEASKDSGKTCMEVLVTELPTNDLGTPIKEIKAAMNDEQPFQPTIGRIVIYRSRTGDYDVPAIVNCTMDTINPKGVEAGGVPALSAPCSVHLTVFSPGKAGLRKAGEKDDFKVRSEHPVSENVSGCYQEWDITHTDLADPDLPRCDDGVVPGTWRWPERV